MAQTPEQILAKANPNSSIFDYGGNKVDALTGNLTPITPTINSETLRPVTPIQYVSPNPVAIPPVSSLDPSSPIQPTYQENQQSDLTKQLMELNQSLVGKKAYQNQAETDAGLADLTKTQTDLSSQLKQLQNEAAAIPMQLQNDATGRGITAGGLQPLQTARLRTNAIQALGVSASLDATNGLISSAQAKALKAVETKYGPIQEQIDAAKANLDLIKNDPSTTLADKNRALAQEAIQNKKQAELNAKIQSEKDKSTLLIDLIKAYPDAGANLNDTLDSVWAKIRDNSKIYQKSVQAAVDNGTTDMQNYNFAVKQGYSGSFIDFQTQQKLAGAGVATTGPGSIPGLGDDVQKQNQLDYQTLNNAQNSISGVLSGYTKTVNGKQVPITLDNIEIEDVAKLKDSDIEAIGIAAALIRNPATARVAGGVVENIFSPNGVIEGFQQWMGEWGGNKYLPTKVLDALKTAKNQYSYNKDQLFNQSNQKGTNQPVNSTSTNTYKVQSGKTIIFP